MTVHGEEGRLPCHNAGLAGQRAWLAGRDSRGASSWRCVGFRVKAHEERERREVFFKKTKVFVLPLLHVQGEEERGTVSFKTTPFRSSLFFFLTWNGVVLDKTHRFIKTGRQNASNFKSALNYLLYISIASLSISVSTPLVGRVFLFSPWPLIYAIEPSIDQ